MSSSPSTEDARNRALLFFMDHLMTKTGSRTIHDLSCQFGARGFSEEMREAVGGTQEALTAFLQSFPSLFSIEGDEVSINQYGSLGGAPNAQPTTKARDYEQEAVDFFINKLKKFGPEMQIKSLLGHRSQAAVECRMVSGRHLKDFVDFLIGHDEAFVVTGDRVRLAVMPEPDDPSLMLDEMGEVLAGARAKQAAVEYLKSYLENNEEIPIGLDAMYSLFCERFPHIVRQDVATNPKELLAFLKLNRQVFFIRSNKVSLVRPRTGDVSPSSQDDGLSTGSDPQHYITATPPPPQISAVKSLKQAQTALAELLAQPLAAANGQQIVAFDCKFVSLGPTTPDFLSLVVVGTPSSRFVVFDAAHSDTIVLESGLRELLENENIVKVMHDCANTANILKSRYDIALKNVFDTQIAHQVYQHVRHGRSLADVRPISFTNLQRMHYPQSLMLTSGNPNLQRVQVNWAQRPIADESLSYICEYAVALVPVLYNTLFNALTPEVMPLLHNLCANRCSLGEVPTADLASLRLNGNGAAGSQPYRPPHFVPKTDENHLSTNGNSQCCSCNCHSTKSEEKIVKTTAEIATQTISTGDITITNVVY